MLASPQPSQSESASIVHVFFHCWTFGLKNAIIGFSIPRMRFFSVNFYSRLKFLFFDWLPFCLSLVCFNRNSHPFSTTCRSKVAIFCHRPLCFPASFKVLHLPHEITQDPAPLFTLSSHSAMGLLWSKIRFSNLENYICTCG
jgi:hypothetical protein